MDDKPLDPKETPPLVPVPDTEPSTAPAVDEPVAEVVAPDDATPDEVTIPEPDPEPAGAGVPAAVAAESMPFDATPLDATPPDATAPEVAPVDVTPPDIAIPEPEAAALATAVEPVADETAVVGSSHEAPDHGVEYPRFRLMARIEHMTLLVSFTILVLTGMPQKFPFSPLSQWIVSMLGGIEVIRMIHRWAAIVLILGSVYHLLTSAYRLFVKHEDMRMLPDLKDATDLRDTVGYNLGFIDEPPKMRKFNFGEKFEYWAVVWGTAVMIITGFILWNPIAATRIIPGVFIPVALEAHGWEAVLAAVSIVIWHLYNVLVKHRNVSMFTGTLSHKIMEEEHALELERLDEGGDPWKVIPPHVLARRRRIYFAVASVVAVAALALVFWMFTFEDTAIIVPQATRDIFVPLATPIP